MLRPTCYVRQESAHLLWPLDLCDRLPDMTTRLHLIDASEVLFRSNFAIKPSSQFTHNGAPTHALFGFVSFLTTYARQVALDKEWMICAFEGEGPHHRTALLPSYKQHRQPVDVALIDQIKLAQEFVKAMAVPMVRVRSFEADDVIATYARIGVEEKIPVRIVSSDKDMMQLMKPGKVELYSPRARKLLNEKDVQERFGCRIDQVLDVQAIWGDSSDGIPGVKGVGQKGAEQIINQYGSLDRALESLRERPARYRAEKLLAEQRDQALMCRELARLNDTLEVPSTRGFCVPDPGADSFVALLREYDYRRLLSSVGRADSGKVGEELLLDQRADDQESGSAEPGAPRARMMVVTEVFEANKADPNEVDAWCEQAWQWGTLALAMTDESNDANGGVRQHWAGVRPDGRAIVVELDPQNKEDWLFERWWRFLAQPGLHVVMTNAKSLLRQLLARDMPWPTVDDVGLMSFCVQAGKLGAHDEVSVLNSLGIPCGDDGVSRAASVLTAYTVLWPKLVSLGVVSVYLTIERPLIELLVRMEHWGIRVDEQKLQRIDEKIQSQRDEHAERVYAVAGYRFNLASRQELAQMLSGLGMTLKRKTKTGQISTASDVLEELAAQGHAVCSDVLGYRSMAKLSATFTQNLLDAVRVDPDARVHTTFVATGAQTGRLSSINPNLQNIPVRTDTGRLIRQAFVADPGHKLIVLDYSQIELRLVAHIANIDGLIEAFAENQDIHTATASAVFGVTPDEVTSNLRRNAKAVNFGIIYGVTAYGLARNLGIGRSAAQEIIDHYFAVYPQLQTYMNDVVAQCASEGFVQTAYGRRVYISGVSSGSSRRPRGHQERQAINAPIQGTAADVIKHAMLEATAQLNAADLSCARCLLQIHDELIYEVPESEAQKACQVVHDAMVAAPRRYRDWRVPFVVSSQIVDHWGAAKS